MPRLPGSAAEIETCARAWRGRSILLRGPDATREEVGPSYHADLDGTFVLADHHPDPERDAIENENELVARRVLSSIRKRDREVLIRFYLDELSPEVICRDMGLTETQFRLIKSRAKARFGELGMRRFPLRSGFRKQQAEVPPAVPA